MSSNQGFSPPRLVRGRGNVRRRGRSNCFSQQASNSRPSTTRYAQLQWTPAMDTILCSVILEDFISRGRESTSSFKGVVLNAAATAVRAQMVDINQPVTGANARSRLIMLKEYRLTKDAMECSGFNITWDDENKYITADPEAWVKYIEAHPCATHLRHKIFPQFDVLKEIFGNDSAGGEENISGFDSDAIDTTVESVGSTLPEDDEVETNLNEAEHGGQNEGVPIEDDLPPPPQDNDINRPTRTPTNPRRRRRVDDSFSKGSETLQVIAQGVQAIVSTMTGTDMTTIFPVLDNLEGLNRSKKMRAYSLLAKDKCLATCFLGLREGDKLDWLLSELESHDTRNSGR